MGNDLTQKKASLASKPCCGLFVCQQCSNQPKTKLANGRKAMNPTAQTLTKELFHAVRADPFLREHVAVRATRCQGACDRPIAWSLNSEQGEGWQFCEAGGKAAISDILAVAKAYVQHTLAGTRSGKADWPEGMGKLFLIRIPAWPRAAKWVRKP